MRPISQAIHVATKFFVDRGVDCASLEMRLQQQEHRRTNLSDNFWSLSAFGVD